MQFISCYAFWMRLLIFDIWSVLQGDGGLFDGEHDEADDGGLFGKGGGGGNDALFD